MGGYRKCGIPHLAVVSDTNVFQNRAKETIFASTSVAHQITLVTVTGQITPALQPCHKRGDSEREKASVAKAHRKGWERQAEVE